MNRARRSSFGRPEFCERVLCWERESGSASRSSSGVTWQFMAGKKPGRVAYMQLSCNRPADFASLGGETVEDSRITRRSLASMPAGGAGQFESILKGWRWAIGRLGVGWIGHDGETGAEALYVRARASLDAGDFTTAERLFASLSDSYPTFAPALEAHAELLDMSGRSALGLAKYRAARDVRRGERRALPDRPVLLRKGAASIADIVAYTRAINSGADRRRAHSFVGRGNAYFATGRTRLALLDYRQALRLKPDAPDVLVLLGEAMRVLGRHKEAMHVFDRAIAGKAGAEVFGSRAIARLALGELDAADADWRRQLDLLPPAPKAARACVLLRLADYQAALPELDGAIEKEPGEPYWHLYRLTALRRLGTTALPAVAAPQAWPGPLIALLEGRLSPAETLDRADNDERRGEALFQLGMDARARDPEAARRLWQQAAALAAADTVEHAAARHELSRAS